MAESATSRPATGSPNRARGASLIDQDSHFHGSYRTPHDLQIDGRYDGEIECQGTVYIGESATVNAHIIAGNVTIAGRCEGEIACDARFEILPTGRVSGSITSAVCVIHEGAVYEGELRMTWPSGDSRRPIALRAERVEPALRPLTPAVPPPPTSEEAPAPLPAPPAVAEPAAEEAPPAPAPTPVSNPSPLRRRTSESREGQNGGPGVNGSAIAAAPLHRNGLNSSAEVG